MHGTLLRRRAAGPSITIGKVGTAWGGASLVGSTCTLAATGQNAGDIWLVGFRVNASTGGISAISGGGVPSTGPGSWAQIGSYVSADSTCNQVVWWGEITTPGSASIVATTSGAPASVTMNAQEFSQSGGTWALDGGDGTAQGGVGTATLPSLTPAGTVVMYFGFIAASGANLSAGATSGYTYEILDGGYDAMCFNVGVPHDVAQAPQVGNAGGWGALAQLIKVA